MKHFFIFELALLWFSFGFGFLEKPVSSPIGFGLYGPIRERIKGTVVSVHDGDTFRFLPSNLTAVPNASTLKVRLIGVDAPEVARPGLPAESFSTEAQERLSSLILNKPFNLLIYSKDRFDRFLASVVVNGEHVSLTLVKEGLAKMYRKSGAEYGDIKVALNNAEAKAKKNGIGLWGKM